MSECSGDFYQSHGYFINSAYRGVQLICKLQRLMLSPRKPDTTLQSLEMVWVDFEKMGEKYSRQTFF